MQAKKTLSTLFLFIGRPPALAWTTKFSLHSSNRPFSASSRATPLTVMEGSKSAQKQITRQEWCEKRGYTGDGGSKATGFCTIVGGGRIGSLLAEAGDHLLLGRGDSIPEDGEGPIYVATRNDALDGIVDNCPASRKKDLVFLQNGYLDNFLAEKGLLSNTQALLYFSVTAKGVEPVDGITSVNPEGLTAVTGGYAEAFAEKLKVLGLKCKVVSEEDYRPAMFEKLIWIATYMLVGTAKECPTVGEAGSNHADLVESVVNELVAAVTAKEGIAFPPGTMERLAAYTDVVSSFPAAVKEFDWRNRYFYDLGDEACPTHNGLLKECAEKGLLGFDLP